MMMTREKAVAQSMFTLDSAGTLLTDLFIKRGIDMDYSVCLWLLKLEFLIVGDLRKRLFVLFVS